MKIPVYCGPRLLEYADEARAMRLARAENAEVVRRRKDKQIMQINLREFGDDSRTPCRPKGNPSAYSHDHETEHNPPKVWTLRRIPDEAGPIFREVVTSCFVGVQ